MRFAQGGAYRRHSHAIAPHPPSGQTRVRGPARRCAAGRARVIGRAFGGAHGGRSRRASAGGNGALNGSHHAGGQLARGPGAAAGSPRWPWRPSPRYRPVHTRSRSGMSWHAPRPPRTLCLSMQPVGADRPVPAVQGQTVSCSVPRRALFYSLTQHREIGPSKRFRRRPRYEAVDDAIRDDFREPPLCSLASRYVRETTRDRHRYVYAYGVRITKAVRETRHMRGDEADETSPRARRSREAN